MSHLQGSEGGSGRERAAAQSAMVVDDDIAVASVPSMRSRRWRGERGADGFIARWLGLLHLERSLELHLGR
ncbi:hypothetical protein [Sorangium sp. So ce1151]|uniref:hypothetical protein n=1 Tax=Sorangium sp. So ce1151 TaxID=3133332 RepID=UPI003F5F98A4